VIDNPLPHLYNKDWKCPDLERLLVVKGETSLLKFTPRYMRTQKKTAAQYPNWQKFCKLIHNSEKHGVLKSKEWCKSQETSRKVTQKDLETLWGDFARFTEAGPEKSWQEYAEWGRKAYQIAGIIPRSVNANLEEERAVPTARQEVTPAPMEVERAGAPQAHADRQVKVPSCHPVILTLLEGKVEDVTAKLKPPERDGSKLPIQDKMWVINNAKNVCHTLPNGQPAPNGLPALLWDRDNYDSFWCDHVKAYKYPYEEVKKADLYREDPPYPLKSLQCLKIRHIV
jgi:hypothetical protein